MLESGDSLLLFETADIVVVEMGAIVVGVVVLRLVESSILLVVVREVKMVVDVILGRV